MFQLMFSVISVNEQLGLLLPVDGILCFALDIDIKEGTTLITFLP